MFGCEDAEVESFAGAESRHYYVVVAGVGIEFFPFEIGVPLFYPLDIPVDVAHVPLSAVAVERVGGSTYAEVRRLVPVAAVMA